MILNKELQVSEKEYVDELIIEDKSYKPTIRRYSEMKKLYLEEADLADETPLYYMFRDLRFSEVESLLEDLNIRIDLTVIENIIIGKEYNKTHGHYHPEAAPGRTFPEIYKVLEGKVYFLLQKGEFKKIEEALLIELNKDDWLFIPPNYGHIMININDDRSITLNIVSSRFIPIYEHYRILKGAVYYLTKEKILANKNYETNPPLKFYKSNFKINNLFENIKKKEITIRALNEPYLIKDYSIFLEEVNEKKFLVLS